MLQNSIDLLPTSSGNIADDYFPDTKGLRNQVCLDLCHCHTAQPPEACSAFAQLEFSGLKQPVSGKHTIKSNGLFGP